MSVTRKPLSRFAPRDLTDKAWYYVNRASVDLCLSSVTGGAQVLSVRLSRKTLQAMVAEVRPRGKRVGR